jgi:hypothetical protein
MLKCNLLGTDPFFRGDHSDIGGGHGKQQNQLASEPLEYIWSEGRRAGVPFGPLPTRQLQSGGAPNDKSINAGFIIGTYLFSPIDSLFNPLDTRYDEIKDLLP